MGLMQEVRVTYLVTLLLDRVSGRGALKVRRRCKNYHRWYFSRKS